MLLHMSFPVRHKVGNVGMFVLLKFQNKLDRELSHFNLNSKHHDKCKFTLKLIWLLTVSNLFILEIVQKRQCCQFVYYGKTRLTMKFHRGICTRGASTSTNGSKRARTKLCTHSFVS